LYQIQMKTVFMCGHIKPRFHAIFDLSSSIYTQASSYKDRLRKINDEITFRKVISANKKSPKKEHF